MSQTSPSSTILSPSKVVHYVKSIEQKLGRTIDRVTILPNGGIEVGMAENAKTGNPADLVDMTE